MKKHFFPFFVLNSNFNKILLKYVVYMYVICVNQFDVSILHLAILIIVLLIYELRAHHGLNKIGNLNFNFNLLITSTCMIGSN